MLGRYFITIVLTSIGCIQSLFADPPTAYQCKGSLVLSDQEYRSHDFFNEKLRSRLTGYYGQKKYNMRLQEVLNQTWYDERIIDMSPVFMEKLLHLVEQHNLTNLIQATVRADNYNWMKFKLHMELILNKETYIKQKPMDVYRKHALALIEDIENLPDSIIKASSITGLEKRLLVARTVMAINNMNLAIERWNAINKEIRDSRRKSRNKTMMMLGLTSVGLAVSISTMVYAGPVIALASRIAASYSSDVVVAAYMARAGRILATSGLGASFGASSKLAVDTGTIVSQANRSSNNLNTDFLCELERKIEHWKKTGISPYVKVALISGVVSVPAGELMLTKLGGKIIYGAIAGSTTIQALYSLNALSDSALMAWAEHRDAIRLYDEAIEYEKLGDLEKSNMVLNQSRQRLLNSRRYWGLAKKNAADSLLYAIALKEVALMGEWESGYSAFKLLGVEFSPEITNDINNFLSFEDSQDS